MLSLKNIGGIAHPPYLFQPAQIANRIWRELAWRSSLWETVRLPWGLEIGVNPREAIGRNISTRGLYDLAVTETLWRLICPGELAVDVGANIGYTASLLAIRAGPAGLVHCFEPHPEIFSRLRENVSRWQRVSDCGSFVLHEVALGEGPGTCFLETNDSFHQNCGTARIVSGEPRGEQARIQVVADSLDAVLSQEQNIGVMKMDTEGSELKILKGMKRTLQRRRVRDIIYEETSGFPAPTHELLQSSGYTVMGLQAGICGVRCLPGRAPAILAGGDPPSYLATMDPARALHLLQRKGWQSFGVLNWMGRRRASARE